jgi:hypothetical protein
MGTFPIENSEVIEGACDFPVLAEFTGQGRFLVFFDREGNPIRAQVHTRHAGTVTNLETGLTLRDPVHRTTFYDFVKRTMTVVGLEFGITVPGKGVVVLEAGKAVFDLDTGEVLQHHHLPGLAGLGLRHGGVQLHLQAERQHPHPEPTEGLLPRAGLHPHIPGLEKTMMSVSREAA